MLNEYQVSLADLATAKVLLNHVEAVTIVRDVITRASRGDLPGVPSAHVIRLNASGEISVEGPIATDERAVPRAALLLNALLPGFDAPPERRAPGALQLVLARAMGTLDLPPYASLNEFDAALARFASASPVATIRALVARSAVAAQAAQSDRPERRAASSQSASPTPGVESTPSRSSAAIPVRLEPRETLTISDIRRARRATGLSLAQISERSHISARLLVELEWGYMRNWPESQYGRTQLVRYAQAAGLDDQLVVRTVWPLLEESVRERHAHAINVTILPLSEELQSTPSAQVAHDAPADRQWGRKRYLAALAIPALLAIGILPALQDGNEGPTASGSEAVAAPIEVAQLESAQASPSVGNNATPLAETDAASAAPAPTLVKAATTGMNSGDARAASPVEGIPGGPAYSPAFASVGSAVFYKDSNASPPVRADAAGEGDGAILRITRIVDDNTQNFHARQSPDGNLIAFDSDRDGERGVYIADADGQNVKRISGDGFAAIPSWSPDGRTLAYVRAETESPDIWNLWTTDVSSGRSRRLTSYKTGAPWGGSWFPDGRRMAYGHETDLVVLDLETGRRRQYESPVEGRPIRTPAVSPDGKRVMFQVYRDGAWLLELSDGSMRKVLSDPSAEEYTWAPDGQRVAYHSRSTDTWGIWIMAPR
jgi:Tol biopolymer transport system component/cytoskeletal protein RodZ